MRKRATRKVTKRRATKRRATRRTKQRGGAINDPTTTSLEGFPLNPNLTSVTMPGKGSMSFKDYERDYTGDPIPDNSP
jgi:hypothetical protein